MLQGSWRRKGVAAVAEATRPAVVRMLRNFILVDESWDLTCQKKVVVIVVLLNSWLRADVECRVESQGFGGSCAPSYTFSSVLTGPNGSRLMKR